MTASLFDHVSSLVEHIGQEKAAAAQEKKGETGIPDPGGMEGATTHPSKKTDDDLQVASEGAQSADNSRIVKDQTDASVDEKPDATPANAPKATDTQVADAKPTGEDPSNEDDYKGKLEGDKKDGDMGGTTHPAKGDYGEKYSADAIAAMSDEELLKTAADLGNDITAEIANNLFSTPTPQPRAKEAAAAGNTVAEQAGNVGDALDKVASEVTQQVVLNAYHQADLVANHLAKEAAELQKQAEGDAEDPTGGAGDGEDYGSGGSADDEGAALLAAMGGGAGGPEMGGEAGGLPPEMGGEAGGLPPEAGGAPDAPVGDIGAELGGMGDEEALQQLAMALLEAGIDPAALAAAAAPGSPGEKIGSAVRNFKNSGRFEFTEAKKGSAQRHVRDYMKGFVRELYSRSRS
jgi:hypothetical protein